MKLTKAKEIIQLNLDEASPRMPPDVREALKLGVEALKRVQWHKEQHISGYYEPLPGETEE